MKNLILGIAMLALSAGPALAQTVRLGTEGAFPPYNFINDAGEVDGFERELGDELCKRVGVSCEWVTTDWDGIIPNLQSGTYDIIMAGMSMTDERAKVVSFTQAYYPPAPSAYMASNADADIKDGAIAAQTGTIQSAYIAKSGAKLVEVATPDEAVAAVRNGKVDAVFADKDFLAPLVAGSGGALVFAGADVKIGGGVGMGLRPSDTELRSKFDAAIQSAKDDGTLNTMIRKWFGDAGATF